MPKSPFFANWEKIKGMKNLMQGDIIIRSKGQYGHVAVVDHVLNGRCKKIFDNLVLERKFVAEKLKKLEGVEGQENEIKITKEYLATTRYEVK